MHDSLQTLRYAPAQAVVVEIRNCQILEGFQIRGNLTIQFVRIEDKSVQVA